jgi:hypothetical protein
VAFERIQQQTREREVAEVIGAEQEAQTALTSEQSDRMKRHCAVS